jgi:hypothetical protein
MGTVNRLIQSKDDRSMAARFVESRAYPFTMTITDGAPRSKAQNRLLHKWMGEIANQKGDLSADEARAYCKLTIGVPILRQQNAAFKERYDEILKPLSYEQKLAIMSEPLNLPVTSLMSTKQLTEYLEAIIRHFGEQGILLTMPDDLKDPKEPNSDDAPSPAPSLEPAGEVSDPPSASPAPTITDAAKDMLTIASLSYSDATERDEAIHAGLEHWWSLTSGSESRLDDISVAARAVATKSRTVEQARAFLAERLGVTIQEFSA